MKTISDLNLGYSDAENYRKSANRNDFNRLFIRNRWLDKLYSPDISFLIGEKGTGKTAYATYLANNNFHNTLAAVRYIRETEYVKFLALKNDKQLTLSDYTHIWKVILYLLLSQQINKAEGRGEFFTRFRQFSSLQKAIDEYYLNAFSPEISNALQLVQEVKTFADLIAKSFKMGAEQKETVTFSETRFQANLLYIQRTFETALSQVRLETSQILFIDGIDIRPRSIQFDDYLECVRGLANAVWEINNDFFPNIRGGKGTLRVVLLVRQDIFASLGLQNLNTKLQDNAVVLDWRVEDAFYRDSDIFAVMDQLLAYQQDKPLNRGEAWDYYFPWKMKEAWGNSTQDSFLAFLRNSHYRPRDIISMLKILQKLIVEEKLDTPTFSGDLLKKPPFIRAYSTHVLGEVRDQLLFYHTTNEYETLLKFFDHLDGHGRFDYPRYQRAFKEYRADLEARQAEIPRFATDSFMFLQNLFELNVISYIERPENDHSYVRWCFRERSHANIYPRVKEGLQYEVFFPLFKALNLGQKLRRQRTIAKR